MKRISLVFLSLLVIVFISGCTQTSNITGLLQKVPDAVDFLEKHPDTYVTFVEVSNPEKIKNYCNKSVPLKDYLRLRLYDEKTGSELILFLDKQTHQLICKKYNKNHNLINQDPKEKCKELGGDFCSSKNECALPWLNSIEYCCPIPCGTCPETVNCDDKNNCTIDYCIVKKGEPVCIHKEITPCPNNGICELGEYEGPIDSYCPGESHAIASAKIKSSDCPKTCDDGNPETGDWYNFTSQKCEHKLCEKKSIQKNIYNVVESIELFGEKRWSQIETIAINYVHQNYYNCTSSSCPKKRFAQMGSRNVLYYKDRNYWSVEIEVEFRELPKFWYEYYLVKVDQETSKVIDCKKIEK